MTAHALRHIAATWLRQATGDSRPVSEYLGDADPSTFSHDAHLVSAELRAGARALALVAFVPSCRPLRGTWLARPLRRGAVHGVQQPVPSCFVEIADTLP